MMSDNKIIALINGIATDISAMQISIGIQSISPNATGISFLLKDGSTQQINISGWHSMTPEEQDKLNKMIVNGIGDLYLNNKGTYSKPIISSIVNNNKIALINLTDWIQDSIDTEKYTVVINHNLNNNHIVPAFWNSSNKLETIGIERLDSNKIRLENTQPLDGELILNYSTTDSNDSMNNIATIKTEYNFATISDRDTYFTSTPIALRNGLIIAVGTSPTQLMSWNGSDSPSNYVSITDSSLWSNQTGLIRGEKGEAGVGVAGIQGKSDYDLAKQNGFVGTLSDWLTSIDSCLGEFENLLALKTKYPPVANGYPNGVNANKFAIINDVKGTGVVSIAFYEDVTTNDWKTTKLNQAIPVG